MVDTPVNKADRPPPPGDPTSQTGIGATDLWLLLVVLIWGSNFTVVKYSLVDFSPLTFTSLRFVVASIAMLAVTRLVGKSLIVKIEDFWRLVGISMIGNVLYQLFFIFGVSNTRAGNAALILATTPIVTAFIGSLSKQEYFTAKGIGGLILAFLGIVIIIFAGHGEVGFGKTTLGDLLLLGATICWSVYTVLARPLVHKYGSLTSTTMMMITGTPVLLLISMFSLYGQQWSSVRTGAWAGLIFSGLFAIAVAYILWNQAVRHIGATRTAVYSNLTVVVAVIVAWPVLGEVPTVGQLVGAVVILMGIYLVRRGMVQEGLRVEAEEVTL